MSREDKRRNKYPMNDGGAFEIFGLIIKQAIEDFACCHKYIYELRVEAKRCRDNRINNQKLFYLIQNYETALYLISKVDCVPDRGGFVNLGCIQREALKIAEEMPHPLNGKKKKIGRKKRWIEKREECA